MEVAHRHARTGEKLLFLVVGIGIALSIFHIFALAFLQDIDDAPYPIFFSMGKAILNGFTPYEDIFETKPPGLFALAALSFALFKSPVLANMLQTILLFLLPTLFTLFAWKKMQHQEKKYRFLALALALLGSIALLRYLLPHPGVWSPDFFSAVFGMLYLLMIANPEKLGRGRIALASLFLFLAIGTKEPIFLSTLAGAIVLLRTPRAFLKGWVLPFILAALAGLLTLALFGWLHSYTSIYLPSMFGGYLQRHTLPIWQKGLAIDLTFANLTSLSPALPILVLGSLLFLLFKDRKDTVERWTAATSLLLILSLFLLLALTGPRLMFYTSQWVLGVLLLFLLPSLYHEWKKRKLRALLLAFLLASGSLLLTSFQWCQRTSPIFALSTNVLSFFPHGADLPCLGSFGMLGIMVLLTFALLPWKTLSREGRTLSLATSLLLAIILFSYLGILIFFFLATPLHRLSPVPGLVIVAGYMAYLARRWNASQRMVLREVLLLSLALFLAITAISLGTDFQNQHYLAATPFYAALLLRSLHIFSQHPPHPYTRYVLPVFALLAAVTTFSSYPYPALSLQKYRANIAETRHTRTLAQESARNLDAILDQCNIDRYYTLKNVSTVNPFEGYTRHTPANFFYFAGIETINTYHDALAVREARNFFSSQLIVTGDVPPPLTRQWEKDIQSFLQEEFTDVPWPCAEGLPTIPHRVLLYRKVPGRVTPLSREMQEWVEQHGD